jgi:protein-S-isoprenylcysteine O-methyltransferase Ste14
MNIVAALFAVIVTLFVWLAVIANPDAVDFMPPQVLQGTFLGLFLIAVALLLLEVFEPEYEDDDAFTRVVKRRAKRVKARVRRRRRGGWV